ncbi:MAG: acyl-CoA thioesterase [Bacteroidetes bacterium]|nr:acyl-CoA thioesterase [Bacteroidota bacterium]
MFISETKIRVRYAETDRMGFVYYGNYATYYEVGRVEALRKLGLSYKDMEDKGVMLPVLEFTIKYFKPAFYDDELIIKTTIEELPTARIIFKNEVFKDGKLLNIGKVTLVFVNTASHRPTQAPEYFLEKIRPYFEENSL